MFEVKKRRQEAEEECSRTPSPESGVEWIFLFEILEARWFEVCLVNARYYQNVPGRRTDVSDCQSKTERSPWPFSSGVTRWQMESPFSTARTIDPEEIIPKTTQEKPSMRAIGQPEPGWCPR